MKTHLIKSFLSEYVCTKNYIYGFSFWHMMYEVYKIDWNDNGERIAMFDELENAEKYVAIMENLET